MRSIQLLFMAALMAALTLTRAGVAQSPDQKQGPPRGLVRPAPIRVDDIVERIMAFDKNKDGKITKDELPERMHHLIALGDTNKDGALDKGEIRKLATTLAAAPGEPGGRGFGVPIRTEGGVRVGPGPGFPGPGFGGVAGVVDDLKLSGKKKKQALAAVKAHEDKVRKLMDKARAELLEKMEEILSEEELADFKAALDRPRGGATFFRVGPRGVPEGGSE